MELISSWAHYIKIIHNCFFQSEKVFLVLFRAFSKNVKILEYVTHV